MTRPASPQSWRFNPPPGWPPAPQGWTPPPGWTSPTSWPAPAAGWTWYLPPISPALRKRPTGLILGGSVAAGVAIFLLVVIAGAVAGPTPTANGTPQAESSPSTNPQPSPAGADALIAKARPGTALAALGLLAVKGRAPTTGYRREMFGQAWADVDRNGCDTRNDVLRRDLTQTLLRADTRGCLVLSGQLADPYTARPISFTRGEATSSAVQVDHVVALSDAWQKGAQPWNLEQRTAFANDPLNLLAIDGPSNASKAAGDAATWLPPSKPYRCSYVARQVAVKVKYEVWVTAAEREAIARILGTCLEQTLPTSSPIPLGGGTVQPAPSPTPAQPPRPTPAPVPAPVPPAQGAHDFANCTDMHGSYPHGIGRPGARDHTSGTPVTTFHVSASLYAANAESDRDGDGIACEKA